MSDNKKYYYLRLKDNFFDSDELKILESMKDGYLYSNILLKLYLRSLKNDGKLVVNDRIPYNAEMLASVTGHQIGTVKQALSIFKDLGLIDVLENGAIYMLDIQNFIGKGSSEADRKREYRQRIETDRTNVQTNLRQISEKSPPEIEIELEKEIKIEKEIDSSASTTTKRKRFEKPSISDIKQYCMERNNNVNAQHFYDYYESNGWKVGKNSMKNWQAAVRTWEKNSYTNTTKQTKKTNTEQTLDAIYKVMNESEVEYGESGCNGSNSVATINDTKF
nr:MAG TPA: DnaD like replication protein [Caudoviricetes sp.]